MVDGQLESIWSQLHYATRALKKEDFALPFYDFDLRASHARTLLPAAFASVPFGFVLVRVRATRALSPVRLVLKVTLFLLLH